MYIGQTIRSITERFNAHYRETRHGMAITIAMQKYGKSCFQIEEIVSCTNQTDLNYLESFFIDYFQTLSPNGYNLCGGGDKKNHISDITRQRLSVSHLGHTHNRGRKHSKEIKIQNSRSNGGKCFVGINIDTKQFFILNYISEVNSLGFNRRDIVSHLKGKRVSVRRHIFLTLDEFLNHANQSGSEELKSFLHAPRLGSEPIYLEYNLPTSLQLPTITKSKSLSLESLNKLGRKVSLNKY